MAENDKKLEEMFGSHPTGSQTGSGAKGADREVRSRKQPKKEKKATAPQQNWDEREYQPIRKSREMRSGCLGGLMYFVFVVSVSVILACLGWMAASDVLALNKPKTEAVVTLDDSVFTDETITTTDAEGNPVEKTISVADMDYVADQLKNEGLTRDCSSSTAKFPMRRRNWTPVPMSCPRTLTTGHW